MSVRTNDTIGKLIASFVEKSTCIKDENLRRVFAKYPELKGQPVPRLRSLDKAFKDAVDELKGVKFILDYEAKEYEAEMLAEIVEGYYNIDIRMKEVEGKNTQFLKVAKLYMNEYGNVEIIWVNGAVNYLPVNIKNRIETTQSRYVWNKEHHDSKTIRSMIDQCMKRFVHIKVKNAVIFLPEGNVNLDVIESLDKAFSECTIGGRVCFTVYTIANDPKTIESLKADMLANFQERANVVDEYVKQAQIIARRLSTATDTEDRKAYIDDLTNIMKIVTNRISHVAEEVELVQDIYPNLADETPIGETIDFNEEGELEIVLDSASGRKRMYINDDGTLTFR